MNPYYVSEANNNLAESSQTHRQQAYVTNGGVRQLLSPPSSDNIGRRKIARFIGQTDITAPPPQLQPQNPQQGLFLGMQQQHQNQLLFPQPMQQSQPSQPSFVNPMQQRQLSQPLLLRPTTQGQVLSAAQQLQSQGWPPLPPPQLLLPSLQQQSQCPQQQLIVPLQQSQQSQWAQVNPTVMGRRTQQINKGEQRISDTNFLAEVMHYQWTRPQNNSIEFWSQYVAKYYDPKARERWCLSKCKDIIIPTRNDGKSCILCGCIPQKGYEVSFEELPARLKNKFDKMMGDRLSPGKAQEHKSTKGATIVLYPNATHQCMYALECVIYIGLLRLVITNQRKILEWEFCASDRKTYVKIQRPLSSCSDSLLGIGEILRKPEAKNVSDESPEENLQRNSQMEQATRPRADKNVSRSTGIMQQANSQEQQIKQTTMNVSRATLSSPTSHDGSRQQNADRMSGKPVSIGANNSQQANSQGKQINQTTMTGSKAIMQSSPTSHDDGSNQNRVIAGQNANQMSGKPVSVSANNSQQANSQGKQINQTTMKGSKAIMQSSPTSHDGSNQNRAIAGQNADQMSGKPVSVGANNSQQANSQGKQINQTTMKGSKAIIQSSPTSHDGSNQNRVIAGQNADWMSGKKPVSVDANSSETSGWSYKYMVTCLLRNAAANLEQEISQNAMSNLQARHPGESSSHMIVGGENTYEVSGDGVTGSMNTAQAKAASPVESREAGLIPDPAMEAQVQDIPVMENPASTDQPPTNQGTTNSQMVMADLQMFVQKLNDNEFEMFNNFTSDDDDRTEATPLENEVDIETYLVETYLSPSLNNN